MKFKSSVLAPISLAALMTLGFTACGDSSDPAPTGPVTSVSSDSAAPAPGPDAGLSSAEAVIPGQDAGISSAEVAAPASSAEATLPENPVVTPVDATEEALVPPTLSCTQEPTIGGQKVTCDGTYAGLISEDQDAVPYNPDQVYTDFVGLQKIYASLTADDKAVFLIRHAARSKDTLGQKGTLTPLGMLQAQYVGQTIAGTEEILYWHSEVPRTEETCKNIAIGRGQANIKHVTLKDLNGGWFEKDAAKIEAYNATVSSSYEVISRYAYGEYNDPAVTYDDAFYDLNEMGQKFMTEIVAGKIAPQSRISIAVSHDQFLYPLAVFASNKMVEMRYHETKEWLNYLAGVAVIIKADGTMKYVLVKGLGEGVQ